MSAAALRERAAGGASAQREGLPRGGSPPCAVAAVLVPTRGELAAARAQMARVTTSPELARAVSAAALMALDGLTKAVSATDMRQVHHWLRWQAAVRVAATERGRALAQERPSVVDGLSPRLLEVAELLAEGLRNKAIAKQLGLAEDTVKHHVSDLIKEYGVAGRSGVAVAYMREVGQLREPTATPARADGAGGSR